MPRPSAGSHHSDKLHVKKGDTVVVLRGKHKGATGKVLLALPRDAKVVVEGVNLVTKHVKPSAANPQGGIEQREGALHASKVALVDPETGKATRVRKAIVDGKKVRVAVKSGKVID
ncbi:50S ribosomal protein L24 [Deinococcus metallilatus]|uniref:Large ribosomal subunit protein uL24 n=1 Tax=Deinococcus metallilatus TaxID=1211322 RepID=A0AAJ5F0C4_9DEIO|nr:large subunit ribosomal protein L24 [Deinococcus metallilatus]QBY09624.1 50S ribosomal protein L24 [Deinococcus metallilatus]RXJ09115.1 50S ribosomal protein L24 [Deinococcus metallilatus]TLK20900.1 50S ribosomal protein L24 [Deinococcus metallilatus]GMA13927.1 50S ribosomal protein L24 [Deinococcus metallilatus]